MKLYNSLTKSIEDIGPQRELGLYTCGPTVYDYVHIGNLRTYIFEDTLRRVLTAQGFRFKHVMNLTDVDDKTIAASKQHYPNQNPMTALASLTSKYESAFLADANSLKIDFSSTTMIRATTEIEAMQAMINAIPNKYITDDGIYFDITQYPQTYGRLVKLDRSHAHHRIDNDDYDKEHVADFALWKTAKPTEPSWEFRIDDHNLAGRPGWHIECAAIATKYLGQPFDIHTGGVDLRFPHHENEIAQAVAADPHHQPLANFFVHAEHLLVENKKMSKRLQNFFTLRDVESHGYHPLSFRLLMLQSHYRSQINFAWEALASAQHFLLSLYNWAEQSHQPTIPLLPDSVFELVLEAVGDDLSTPKALAELAKLSAQRPSVKLLAALDQLFGLGLSQRPDIDASLKQLINDREQARLSKDFATSDRLRNQLQKQGVLIEDTKLGPRWRRAAI